MIAAICVVLAGLLSANAVGSTSANCNSPEAPSPSAGVEVGQTPTAGTIVAHAQVVAEPGAVPRPDSATSVPSVTGPAVGLSIRVAQPDAADSIIADQITDDRGEAQFDLAPGTYWLIVPWVSNITGFEGAPTLATYLPTGEPVLAWQEVTLTDGGSVDVVLTIGVALP